MPEPILEIRGKRELQVKFNRLIRAIDFKVWTTRACLHVLRYAKKERFRSAAGAAPVPGILTSRVGGAGLRGSIQYEVSQRASEWFGRVGVPKWSDAAKYARLHETGEPRVILPKKGKWLWFRPWGSPHVIRVRQVHTQKRPYLAPALKAMKPMIEREYKDRCWEAVKRAALA